MTNDQFPLSIAEWRRLTLHMSAAHATYFLNLAFWAWQHPGTGIPINVEAQMQIANCTDRKTWRTVWARLQPMFEKQPGTGYHTLPWVEDLRRKFVPVEIPTQRQNQAQFRGSPVENPVEIHPADRPITGGPISLISTDQDQEQEQEQGVPSSFADFSEKDRRQISVVAAAGFLAREVLRAAGVPMPTREFKAAVYRVAVTAFPDGDAGVEWREAVVAAAWSPAAWRQWRLWLAYDERKGVLALLPVGQSRSSQGGPHRQPAGRF